MRILIVHTQRSDIKQDDDKGGTIVVVEESYLKIGETSTQQEASESGSLR